MGEKYPTRLRNSPGLYASGKSQVLLVTLGERSRGQGLRREGWVECDASWR